MSDLVHSGAAPLHTQPGAAEGGCNWSEVGPRAMAALTDYLIWTERFVGRLSEAQSDALFEAYRVGRTVTFAADPEADQARMAGLRTTTAASESAVGMTTAKPEECTQ